MEENYLGTSSFSRPSEEETEVFKEAREGNAESVLLYLKRCPRLALSRDLQGHTLLHWAALNNMILLTRYLVEELSADVDACALNGQTPLMWATVNEHLLLMQYLIKRTTKINHPDSKGATAVLIAAQRDCLHGFLLLQKAGADTSHSDINGSTLAHWAAFRGNVTLLRLLHYFAVDFFVRDNEKMLPLHMSALRNHWEASRFLLETIRQDALDSEATETPMELVKTSSFPNPNVIALFEYAVKVWGPGATQKTSEIEQRPLEDGESETDDATRILGQTKTGHPLLRKLAPMLLQQDHLPPLLCLISLSIMFYVWIARCHGYLSDGWLLYPGYVCTFFSFVVYIALLRFSPGVMAKRKRPNSAIEEMQDKLSNPRAASLRFAEEIDLTRVCWTCWIMRDLRTKHCQDCNACVENFDHHCVWIRNCVGKNNHRLFLFWVGILLLSQIIHMTSCLGIVTSTFLRFTTTSEGSFPFIPLILSLLEEPSCSFAILIHMLSFWWLLLLFWYQCRGVATNMTTNEEINAARYSHFFQSKQFWTTEGPVLRKRLRNPFDEGIFLNCWNFWRGRRSGQFDPEVVRKRDENSGWLDREQRLAQSMAAVGLELPEMRKHTDVLKGWGANGQPQTGIDRIESTRASISNSCSRADTSEDSQASVIGVCVEECCEQNV